MVGFENSEQRYGWLSMFLHWAIAITLMISVGYAYSRGFIPRDQREARTAVMALHFNWSWVVLALVTPRIIWRVVTQSPDDINQDKRLIVAHRVVVGFLAWTPIILTVTGAGVIWAGGQNVEIFGFTVLTGLAERSRSLRDVMEVAHVGLWYLFASVLVLHIGAAMWHHRVKKDQTLHRMLPWGKVP